MENGAISDGQITASSFHTHSWIDHSPYLARLHLQHISDAQAGGWLAALPNDASQWLQIDLGNQFFNVTRVATQGRQSSNQKVTKYNLQYSDDGVAFNWYENDQGQPKVSYSMVIVMLNEKHSAYSRAFYAKIKTTMMIFSVLSNAHK